MFRLLLCCFLCASAAAAAAAPPPEVLQLSGREGVTQPVLVEVPDNPFAAVVLYAGGNGGVLFSGNEVATYGGNFLIRARPEFLKQGLIVAIMGAPSDLQAPKYLDDAFRLSDAHAADSRAVVDALRERFKLPVWLVGTSRGTFSAASVGLKLGKAVDGVVLTSTMGDMAGLPVDRFAMPVLLVHHEYDPCPVTAWRDARRMVEKLGAPRKDLLGFAGGNNRGPACEAKGYHGFSGIEADVVAAIAKWIQSP